MNALWSFLMAFGLYGYGGPPRIPSTSPLNPQPGVTMSAPKTPPAQNYMRQQIAGAMASPQPVMGNAPNGLRMSGFSPKRL